MGQPYASQGCQDADGHNQNNGQWQAQTFILGSEHQEYQQNADWEYPECRIAGQGLLVSQIGPLVFDASWERLGGDALDSSFCLIRRVTWSWTTIDICCRKAVVTNDHFWAIGWLNFDQRRQWHHFASSVASFQHADILSAGAEWSICLNADLVDATKAVEVIHIQRAKIDLHRIKHIGDGYTQLFCLHAVQIHVQLRNVDLIAREHRAKLGSFRSLRDER